MLARYAHGGVVWIDLEAPTREEVLAVATEFGIDDIVAQELLSPSARPHAERHSNYFYVILHFPALRHSHKTREQEIDFVIGKNFIVTAHYDTIDPLHKFTKIFEVNSVLDKSSIGDHAGFLFYFMLKKLYKAVEHEVEYVRQDLARIEDHIFGGLEVRMVEIISQSARDLLNLRQTIEPHREILHDYEVESPAFFGDTYTQYAKAISNEYYRVHNHIMRATEGLHELRETNNSMLTIKQNETIRVFTILAFMTFPLTLLVTVMSMNAIDNPFHASSSGFKMVIALVILGTLAEIAFFKYKKWL